MNKAAKIIMQQLSNEGVKHSEDFGIHFIACKREVGALYLGIDENLTRAVHEAMKQAARITALLIKLDDALGPDYEDTLDDLLVDDDEKVGG